MARFRKTFSYACSPPRPFRASWLAQVDVYVQGAKRQGSADSNLRSNSTIRVFGVLEMTFSTEILQILYCFLIPMWEPIILGYSIYYVCLFNCGDFEAKDGGLVLYRSASSELTRQCIASERFEIGCSSTIEFID